MTDDIVARLRDTKRQRTWWPRDRLEAADEIERLRAALAPLVEIANSYDDAHLDEHRPSWGDRDPRTIELFSGRGGRQLLTLQQCLDARAALAGAASDDDVELNDQTWGRER